MNYIFFTNWRGEEEMGGSHYDFDRMCQVIESFLRTNSQREFAFVSACRKHPDGSIEEVVSWRKGSDVPIFDKRPLSPKPPA